MENQPNKLKEAQQVSTTNLINRNNYLQSSKGQRFLGSASNGQRRKIRGNKPFNAYDNQFDEDYQPGGVGSSDYQLNDYLQKTYKGIYFEFYCLDWGIRNEYDELLDDETGKVSSDIFTSSANQANEFSSKYSSIKNKETSQQEMRPPSRHKTPTKAVGLDDLPGTPRTPPDNKQLKIANKADDNIETIVSLEPKGDLFRK